MAAGLITYKTILPGQPGTKALMNKNEMELVCVRYKYDKPKHRKIKTAEFIIKSWNDERNTLKVPFNKIVHLKVEYGERQIGTLIRAAGGKWNKEKKYWELPYREVKSLGLEERIIP